MAKDKNPTGLGPRIKLSRETAGLSQTELGKEFGLTRSAVSQWESETTEPTPENLRQIAMRSGADYDWLATGRGEPNFAGGDKRTAPKSSALTTSAIGHSNSSTFGEPSRIGDPVTGFTRVPIRGQAMGGKDGALVFKAEDNMGDILAPPILYNVPDAYAVYVSGSSMEPKFDPGDIVYVHPHQPVRKNDYCVIQVAGKDGDQPQGWVKRFVSRDSKFLKVQQFNPKRILSFPASKVVSCHRIIMSGPV